jgi:hypothetical protein
LGAVKIDLGAGFDTGLGAGFDTGLGAGFDAVKVDLGTLKADLGAVTGFTLSFTLTFAPILTLDLNGIFAALHKATATRTATTNRRNIVVFMSW